MVNTHRLRAFVAPACLVCLIALLVVPAVSMATVRLSFAFAENSPPYSLSQDEKAVGLLPDLVQLVFSFMPDYTTESAVMPWSRAQYNVRQGFTDGFLTYPSNERQAYAIFSGRPVFTQDFGHLVYSAENPNTDVIESAGSFSDLSGLKVIVEKGSKWEDDNIPDYLERVPGRDPETMMHLLMLRKAGDFLLMPAEDARFHARELGYSENLKIRKVDFIPNSRVPFHLGISKRFPSAMDVINQVEAVMQRPVFESQLNMLIDRYR